MSCRTKATEPVEVPASVVFEAVIVVCLGVNEDIAQRLDLLQDCFKWN